MKRKIFIGICTILAAMFFVSCSDTNQFHEKFLKDGDRVYASRIDRADAFSGHDRIVLRIHTTTRRAEKVRISWGSGSDQAVTVDFPASLAEDGYFDHNLPLAEGGYTFTFVSYDGFGNASIPVEAVGTSYGSSYIATLVSRIVRTATVGDDGAMTIDWYTSPPNALHLVLSYTDTQGAAQTLDVPAATMTTSVPNVDKTRPVTYKTAYRPEATSVDVFYSDTQPVTFNL